MRKLTCLAGAVLLALSMPVAAEQRVVCTLVIEIGSPAPLVEDGDCEEPMSPASTFKIPISLMAFDAGIFVSPSQPEWPFQEGYADWVPNWRQATTPRSWMRDSVVWFSQRATERLGEERFADYVHAFDYGNLDLSGDQGRSNGLTNSWLSSSLQITPVEQVAFLTRMLGRHLPVSGHAVEQTMGLLDYGVQPNGWHIFGKTGGGMPRGEDGQLLRGQPFGWYVGWAQRDDRRVVFARLVRFSERPAMPAGRLARDGLLDELFGPSGLPD